MEKDLKHADHFQEDFYGDFYDFFANYIKFKKLTSQVSKKARLVLYLNTQTSEYKLVFDQDLHFLPADSVIDSKKGAAVTLKKLRQKFMASNQHDLIQNFNATLGEIFIKNQLGKNNTCFWLA